MWACGRVGKTANGRMGETAKEAIEALVLFGSEVASHNSPAAAGLTAQRLYIIAQVL